MRNLTTLQNTLLDVDGQGYGNYKRLKGTYDMGEFTLSVDHTQSDPYAPPSKIRVLMSSDQIQLPQEILRTKQQRIAAADFLARRFHAAAVPHEELKAYAHGQEVIERSTVVISDHHVEVRLEVSLPAAGRRIEGRTALRIFTRDLPKVVQHSLTPHSRDDNALAEHVSLYLDQLSIVAGLHKRGLVAFIGDGSVLPRRSGNSDLPLEHGAVPFTSPESLAVTFDLPGGGSVRGMGIPEGVTVIVGGGFHGKSTLLASIANGVYPHIKADGREWVLTREDAVGIRAEDGRAVTGVDISWFISNLPTGANTHEFTTTNASGSTSQAANVVEAWAASPSVLLIDEDTSATNFMIRDERMKQLVPTRKEPIIPFTERVKPLWEHAGISTILVAGGSGAFFDVADHVIVMEDYCPKNVTEEAHRIARHTPTQEMSQKTAREKWPCRTPASRTPHPSSLNPRSKTKPNRAKGKKEIQVGRETIDLTAVSQLVDAGQTAAIAHVLDSWARDSAPRATVEQAVREVITQIHQHGIDVLSPHRGHPGYLAAPRRYELHAAVNRFRGLQITVHTGDTTDR